MGSQTETLPPQARPGRRVAEAGRRYDISPQTVIRHIRKGVRLSDGSIVRLPATLMPGGYRVRDEDADAFYAKLTRDRLGVEAAPLAPTPGPKSHADADAALAADGW
jgi:hypothetical protein